MTIMTRPRMIEKHEQLTPITIFISYARQDGRALAMRLRDDLNNAGHHAWLDTSEIPGGADWARDIENAIEQSDVVLALLSAGSFASETCRAEQMRALRKNKRVLPILVQRDAERPLYFENLNYFDFSNPGGYGARLTALMKDLNPRQRSSGGSASVFTPKVWSHSAMPMLDEKPDAEAFGKHLEALRGSQWLGGRYWWPYFLFYVADIQTITTILRDEVITSDQDENDQDRWKDFVHLDFRPQTPDLWRKEGIRPNQSVIYQMPVYLLFDFEPLIRRADSRFTEGDIYRLRKSHKRAADFAALPFERIYHNSWFPAEERDDIMLRRQAAVLIPKRLELEHLRSIWCRSAAERETLQSLLPEHMWAQWSDKITARSDFDLFHRNWVYVEEAELSATRVQLDFKAWKEEESPSFALRIEAEENRGKTHIFTQDDFIPDGEYSLELSGVNPLKEYTLRAYLDDALAYAGTYLP